MLAKRGLKPPAKMQARIEAERNLLCLERWLDAAVTATSVAEVFIDA